MDRNFSYSEAGNVIIVALLAEGVDRNKVGVTLSPNTNPSPSSRRAWIEILETNLDNTQMAVALLAEGVDRNTIWAVFWAATQSSPSSRRAWIEMP